MPTGGLDWMVPSHVVRYTAGLGRLCHSLRATGTGTPGGMERGSSKHGPRLDDELEHEVRGLLQGQNTEGRVEEWHDPEPSGEDQPVVGEYPDSGDDLPGGAPAGITAAEADRRAYFASFLSRSLFPADRARLRAAA